MICEERLFFFLGKHEERFSVRGLFRRHQEFQAEAACAADVRTFESRTEHMTRHDEGRSSANRTNMKKTWPQP